MSHNLDNITSTQSMDDLYRSLSFGCGCFAVFLCAFGLIGNSLSLYVFWKYTKRGHGKSINLLLSGLSLTDLCVCALGVPVLFLRSFVPASYHKEPPRQFKLFYFNMIIYVSPFLLCVQFLSAWLLVLITFERYLAVCKPLLARVYCRKRRTASVMLIMLIVIVAFIAPRFYDFKVVWKDDNEPQLVPGLRALKLYNLWYMSVSYCLFIFFLPFVLLSTLSGCIIRSILHAQFVRRSMTDQEVVENDTTRMLLAVVTVFMVCYIPSVVLNFFELFSNNMFDGKAKGNLLNDLNNILVTFNSASTVLVYLRFCRRYRECTLELITRLCSPYIRLPLEDTFPLTRYQNYHNNSGRKEPLGHKGTVPVDLMSDGHQEPTVHRTVRRIESSAIVPRMWRKLTVSDSVLVLPQINGSNEIPLSPKTQNTTSDIDQ